MDRAGLDQRSTFDTCTDILFIIRRQQPSVIGEVFMCAEGGLNTRIFEKENYNDCDWRKKTGKTKKNGKTDEYSLTIPTSEMTRNFVNNILSYYLYSHIIISHVIIRPILHRAYPTKPSNLHALQ